MRGSAGSEHSEHSGHDVGRRALLARMGVLGASAAVAGILPGTVGTAEARQVDDLGLGRLLGLLRPVLDELARDTLNGLVVMTCPGPDAYSRAQGTPRAELGAIEAKASDFLSVALDNFVPFPDQLVTPITAALASGLAETPIPLPASLLGIPLSRINTLDAALRSLLHNDEALPLSVVIAMLLNLVATEVAPAAVSGPFLSPFARLSYDQKCEAFALMEGTDAKLLALLDTGLPMPLRESLSGLLEFVAGALLEFATYGAYGEWATYDRVSRTLRTRPVGWRLSDYQPDGPVDGWDEFLGYYQGRREAENV